ncbi:hypothetical protein [Nocardioides sp. 1609]|uniref:hypothetical protein n=1 Tax=Nocardioides sp. 1609 TaxID=2508327 RepID=UPI00106F1BFB|nr:hypothetical protein [Nocardioides sp. 1609]
MTWTSFHRRAETLRRVVATANSRRDGVLPTDVDGVAETFADDLDLLGALQLAWHTRLGGHLDRRLAEEPLDLPAAVVAAWGAAYRDLPGVRAVLDAGRERPADDATALATARAAVKEHALLAVTSGLAGLGDDAAAAPIGAALEERARAAVAAVEERRDVPARSLLGRIRAALAA